MQRTLISNNSPINKTSCIEHMPISIFTVVLGFSGLTLAWHKAREIIVVPPAITDFLRFFSTSVFVFLLVAYTRKSLSFADAVHNEIKHPIRINFFATISISTLLLATSWFHSTPQTATVLWFIGTVLHLLITIRIINSWIYHSHYEVKHANPSWFIPVVGNIIIPILGVKVAPLELSWLFFSIGIFFWLVLLTIILNRIFFYEPLPARLTPTIFILLAPPSIGFIAWTNLVGHLDAFAHLLYYVALFFALLLGGKTTYFLRLQFSLSAWAYSFPLAAFTMATFQMAKLSELTIFSWLGCLLLATATLVSISLAIRTLIAVKRNEICLPEN